MKPNFSEEKKLQNQGFAFVAGVDEAGRGPLAGPVVAAAIIFKNKNSKNFSEIKDSKKLNRKQREKIYGFLTTSPDVAWGVGVVSEKVIDKINIFEATKLAMQKAIKDLGTQPDFLLIDGNFKVKEIKIPQKPIIKGDAKVFSISAASVIAKVTRDRIMDKYHKQFPQYGFDRHKGYGTSAHFEAIKSFGPCKIHRKTFYPVSLYL